MEAVKSGTSFNRCKATLHFPIVPLITKEIDYEDLNTNKKILKKEK